MRMQMSVRRRQMLRAAVVVVLVALTACDAGEPPLAPSRSPVPVFVPPPTPAVPGYQASGTVTDRAGLPLAGASVEVDFRGNTVGSHVLGKTDGGGRYDLSFQPTGPLGDEGGALLIVSAEGYQSHWQYLAWGVVDAVTDVRLPSLQTIVAGQSLSVAVEPDSSFCSDGDIARLVDLLCVQVQVLTASSGTLTVSARALAEGAPVFTVFAATDWYRSLTLGTGTVSVSLEGVRSGGIYTLYVGVPRASAPQRYEVSTALQAVAPATPR